MLEADEVASVLVARRGAWTDSWTLQKLLYYVQAWHLAVTDEPLFRQQIKAWADGPVVPQVWQSRKPRETRRPAEQDVDSIELDGLASDLIDLVLASYGSMSGNELRALTHAEEPWKNARGNLPEDAECREPISRDDMATFYREHRRLGGRSASDLAAGGIDQAPASHAGPLDVAAILAALADDDMDHDDPWGGANLADSRNIDDHGLNHQQRRMYAGS